VSAFRVVEDELSRITEFISLYIELVEELEVEGDVQQRLRAQLICV
jgi:hypothetical protein